MATIKGRIAALEGIHGIADKILFVHIRSFQAGASITSASYGDWSIDRKPSESESEFEDRAAAEVRKLPRDDSQKVICVLLKERAANHGNANENS